MVQAFGLDAVRLLAHGSDFTADEFGTLALLSLPTLILFIALVGAAYVRQGRRRTVEDAGGAAVRNAPAEAVDGGGSGADPS